MADRKLSNTRLNAAIVVCTVLHIAQHTLACLHAHPCSGALLNAGVDLREAQNYTQIRKKNCSTLFNCVHIVHNDYCLLDSIVISCIKVDSASKYSLIHIKFFIRYG